MITKLDIKNYESWEKATLHFPEGPGLIVFVGESDRGKSGLFRAFDFVTKNTSGNEMLPKYWKGNTQVIVEKDDGHYFTRLKGKSVNTYQINNNDPINAGTGVPTEVKDLLNISDINFQDQSDRAFLMFDTSGERGRVLNRITGLDKIDSSLSASKSDVLRINRNMEHKKELIESTEKKLIRFKVLPAGEDLIMQAQELERKMSTTKSTINLVEGLLYTKQKAQTSAQHFKNLSIAIELQDEVEVTLNEYLIVEKNINMMRQAFKRKKVLKNSEIEPTTLLRLNDLITESEAMVLQINKAELSVQKLEDFLYAKDKKKVTLKWTKKQVEELKKTIPNICPECGSEVKDVFMES